MGSIGIKRIGRMGRRGMVGGRKVGVGGLGDCVWR